MLADGESSWYWNHSHPSIDHSHHGATLGSREMMAPRYRVLSFGPRIVPGMTSDGSGSCTMLSHRNDVVLSQLMDADDASM